MYYYFLLSLTSSKRENRLERDASSLLLLIADLSNSSSNLKTVFLTRCCCWWCSHCILRKKLVYYPPFSFLITQQDDEIRTHIHVFDVGSPLLFVKFPQISRSVLSLLSLSLLLHHSFVYINIYKTSERVPLPSSSYPKQKKSAYREEGWRERERESRGLQTPFFNGDYILCDCSLMGKRRRQQNQEGEMPRLLLKNLDGILLSRIYFYN